MDIGEVVKRTGVPASTLRFYEEKGLITSVGRQGLKRVFNPDVQERLALIALGRSAGFSLDEIAQMFAPDGQLAIDRQMLLRKAKDIDQTILRLRAMSEGLRHAAVCPAPSHLACVSFQRLLKHAAAQVASAQASPEPPRQRKNRLQ
ncbi:MAG TPA: helix-turn-helix domain-containing protein [Burkholderiaceae bacterium]|nr:helix-turn-helix domain-containing protein [Burkholderiaceae bacterium]